MKIKKIPREGYDVSITMSGRELQCLLSILNWYPDVINIVISKSKGWRGPLYDFTREEMEMIAGKFWEAGREVMKQ